MKKTNILFCVAIVFGLFVGCGSSYDSPSEVVEKYHQAIFDKDIETVMSLSAGKDDREFVKEVIEFRSRGMKRSGGLPEILDEHVDGDKAIVRCKFGPAEQDVFLRKIDGEWKVE